jgi:hypothetical protein
VTRHGGIGAHRRRTSAELGWKGGRHVKGSSRLSVLHRPRSAVVSRQGYERSRSLGSFGAGGDAERDVAHPCRGRRARGGRAARVCKPDLRRLCTHGDGARERARARAGCGEVLAGRGRAQRTADDAPAQRATTLARSSCTEGRAIRTEDRTRCAAGGVRAQRRARVEARAKACTGCRARGRACSARNLSTHGGAARGQAPLGGDRDERTPHRRS